MDERRAVSVRNTNGVKGRRGTDATGEIEITDCFWRYEKLATMLNEQFAGTLEMPERPIRREDAEVADGLKPS